MDNKLPEQPRICIVRLSAIGDVCMMVPTVKTIQKGLPNAQITWIISNPGYELVKDLPGVEFLVINKPRSFKDYIKLYKQLGQYQFDIVLATQANMRVNLLYPAIKSPRKIGFDKLRARDMQWLFTNEKIEFKDQHLVESFLEFAIKAGASACEINWNIPLSDDDNNKAKEIINSKKTKHSIAINPFTSKDERNWDLQRYAQLIDQIYNKYGCHIILTGGADPKEQAKIQKIIDLCQNREKITNSSGTLSLKQLAALLSNVDCLISPDTAAVHIASAMKTAVIGLYAVAPSKLSGPYFSKQLTLDKFGDAVAKILNKKLEDIPWKTRVHDSRAMQLIQVEDVMDKIATALNTGD